MEPHFNRRYQPPRVNYTERHNSLRMKSNRSKQRERRFGSLFPLFPSVHSFDPQKILSPCINRRDLALAGQLAEGVFKRRDAKNAEKRAFDAAIVELPTDNLHRNCTHFGFNFGRTKRRRHPVRRSVRPLRDTLAFCLLPLLASRPLEFGFRISDFRAAGLALQTLREEGACGREREASWSAPAKRSGDGAFDRPGPPPGPGASQPKAVSRSACHRTPNASRGRGARPRSRSALECGIPTESGLSGGTPVTVETQGRSRAPPSESGAVAPRSKTSRTSGCPR